MRALVFGGSGQVGAALLPRLRAAGWEMVAVSRDPHVASPGLRWLRGDLAHCDGLPDAVDAIFSCGPLDHFAFWLARSTLRAPRIVAFGSTSVTVKQASRDAAERDVAGRLAEGEQRVFDAAAARGAPATVLRPTLVYGAGRDQTLARLARFASKRGWLPLPAGATGLRQPVHVDDLAQAAMEVLDAPGTQGRAFALPGGETLPFREMVARTLAALPSTPRLLEVPAPLFAAVAGAVRLVGRGIGAGAIARLREDLVFDPGPAAAAFGYAPRRFQPEAVLPAG